MKIRFTTTGDFEILLENDLEREIFPCIIRDARALGEEWASDSLGPDFDDEWFPGWQEWVQPEVQETFSAQLDSIKRYNKISENVMNIPAQYLESWYGAVNQARMVLESIFRFSEEELPDSYEEVMSVNAGQWPEDKLSAYQRMHFYTWFQEILLDGLIQHSPWNRAQDAPAEGGGATGGVKDSGEDDMDGEGGLFGKE